ncbi:CdaR family transcriptional regulator [Levilactobacillus bambusae]|uniref:Sugar diacid utilization regulator n=1 Tax=Levilactobacillus bambusae TaxID=2024736 RepID=A0A2V1N0J0_9LACO|nr:sugar diacid recognition domain-containing protein [Levilactobacillus bambusae]PWG00258.1 hypothetical protein DCM90_04805 [Levilactobacillus bambusae]
MKISSTLAQSIVDHMMKQIPYNINMMNESGDIIASGDAARIGCHHVGAEMAIQQRQTLAMDYDYGDHGQPGVNMPIWFEDQIIGVIGITGQPQTVQPFARLLVTATVLLLQQHQQNARSAARESQLTRFISQWLQSQAPLRESSLVMAARELHVDLTLPRQVLCLIGPNSNAFRTDALDYSLQTNDQMRLIITNQPKTLNRALQFAERSHCELGIGTPTTWLQQSTAEARRTITLQRLLKQPQLQTYEEARLTDELLRHRLKLPRMAQHYRDLKEASDVDFMTTFMAYFQNNGHAGQTATQLHIHRNTLTYRFNQAKDLTGLDFRRFTNLFQFALLWLYDQDEAT